MVHAASDIKLTMQTYSDPELLDETEALDALPEMKVEKDGGAAGPEADSPARPPA